MAERVDIELDDGRATVILPIEWVEARPVLQDYLESRRNHLAVVHDGLREHLDMRLDKMEVSMRDVAMTQREHGERLDIHQGELTRLHNQQINVIASVNATLSNVGTLLGHLTERVAKSEYVMAAIGVGVFTGLILLAGIAYKLFK